MRELQPKPLLRIKAERLARGWTQLELAYRSRVPVSELSRIETGRCKPYALSVADGVLKIKQVHAEDEPTPLPGWLQRGTSLDDFEGKIFSVGLSSGVTAGPRAESRCFNSAMSWNVYWESRC